MKKGCVQRKTATLFLLSFLLLISSCGKTETSDSFEFTFTDDATRASELVADANDDLNRIKIMYKKNESQLEELKAAINEKNTEKVKKITEDLVYIINDGMALGEKAVGKIEKARDMNINSDFKEYLNLKIESLEKQMEAFENRRQAARLLRDSFGTNDQSQIEKAKAAFKEKEESFQKTMETARELSKKANDFAKESAKKQN